MPSLKLLKQNLMVERSFKDHVSQTSVEGSIQLPPSKLKKRCNLFYNQKIVDVSWGLIVLVEEPQA